MTHVCLKVIGATENDNSPSALWGLAHWQGGDDWESLHQHCKDIFAAVKTLQRHGYIDIDFPSARRGTNTQRIRLDMFLCSDAAFLDAEEGGGGFCVEESCVICKCPKGEFGDSEHKVNWPEKTAKYLANSSHMPHNGVHKFNCPHDGCNFKSSGKRQWEKERARLTKLTASQVTAFKRNHQGQYPLRYKLFPLPIDKTIPDTMHFLMGVIGHQWKHGVGFYIDSNDLAIKVNEQLKKKCGVIANYTKVSQGKHIDVAKMPKLPGAQSLKVIEYHDLFLEMVCHWGGRNRHGESAVANKKTKCIQANDALIELWNELMEPMEIEDGQKTASYEERLDKANLIEAAVEDWRDAYTNAYGKDAVGSAHQTKVVYF